MNDELVPQNLVEGQPGQSAIVTLSSGASLQEVVARVQIVREALKNVLEQGIDKDFNAIPGTTKPTLLLPGAEKLAAIFGLSVSLEVERIDLPGGHRECIVKASLTQMRTGALVGQAVGSCSTLESKYRYRVAPKKLTDREVPKKYWEIRKSDPKGAQQLLGGPGFSIKKGDGGIWFIAEGSDERVENPDIADTYNTVLKIATKRAVVSAIRFVSTSSDLFSVDMEESHGNQHETDEAGVAGVAGRGRASRDVAGKEEAAPAEKPAVASELETWASVGIKDVVEDETKAGRKFNVILTSDGRKAWTFNGALANQIANLLFADLQVKKTATGSFEVVNAQEVAEAAPI